MDDICGMRIVDFVDNSGSDEQRSSHLRSNRLLCLFTGDPGSDLLSWQKSFFVRIAVLVIIVVSVLYSFALSSILPVSVVIFRL